MSDINKVLQVKELLFKLTYTGNANKPVVEIYINEFNTLLDCVFPQTVGYIVINSIIDLFTELKNSNKILLINEIGGYIPDYDFSNVTKNNLVFPVMNLGIIVGYVVFSISDGNNISLTLLDTTLNLITDENDFSFTTFMSIKIYE